MRIKLWLTYDGTNYCGWQRQKNGTSVQQIVEECIFSLTGENTKAIASGRTDAGVHSEGQVLHFDTNSSIPPEKFYLALNALFPEDIKATKSEAADSDFNARYSAKQKTYRYSFYFSNVILPLKNRYAAMCALTPDMGKMRMALEKFVGEKDFAAFSCKDSSVKSTVRKIYSARLTETDGGFYIDITGNGFLYNMVRIIAGAALAVGSGQAELSDIDISFETGERNKKFITLPARGLTLLEVKYE